MRTGREPLESTLARPSSTPSTCTQVLLVLTSWFATGAGGPRQYLELAGQPDAPLELFYTDPTTQSLYKWFVSLVRRSQPPIIMTNDWAGRRAGGASTAQLAMSDT